MTPSLTPSKARRNSHYILVNGKKVGITTNCRNGLRHLRNRIGVRTIWVDTVCIAPDMSDKNQQLPLMTSIYGKARKVYIWLGEPSEGDVSERALDWLQAISVDTHPLLGVRFSNFPKNMHPWEVAKLIGFITQFIRASKLFDLLMCVNGTYSCIAEIHLLSLGSHVHEYDHEAIRDIIGRQWFTRIWTIQEAAMAERPVVVCGGKEIQWNNLFWGVVEARDRAPTTTRGDFSRITDSITLMYSFWLEVSRVSEFSVSKHRKWFTESSWFYKKIWISFLELMEESGPTLFYVQITMIATTIMVRLFRGLRPLDSIPLLVLVLICVLTRLLTPPKTDHQWDDKLRSMFVDVISKSRIQESTNPKDKVYALYGLLQSLEFKPLPKVDYSAENSLEDTYSSFTRSIIRWHRSLDIFREASGPWGCNAPSWVPDWSRQYKQLRLPDGRTRTEHPSKTDNPPCTFSENNRELTVSGKKFGTLIFRVGLMESLPVEFDMDESSTSNSRLLSHHRNIITLREWLILVRGLFTSMDALSGILTSISNLQSLCTADGFREWAEVLLNDRLTIPCQEIESFMGVSISAEDARRITEYIRHRDTVSTGLEWRILLLLATDEKLWGLHQGVCSILAEKATLFVAKAQSSYWLGVGPHHSRKGDIITILATMKNPMVLRTVDDAEGKFHLIGVAYIPQLPWAKLWPKEEAKRESIILV